MKKIIISSHAAFNMLERGASEEEVIDVISTGEWKAAKQSRFQARKSFDCFATSPMNAKTYSLKTVEPVFVDEPEAITVVTVKVYYHND